MWTFSEIRPDAIEGFAPANSSMNIAQNPDLFLSLYASIEGEGAEVSYQGSEKAYKALHTDCCQGALALHDIRLLVGCEQGQPRRIQHLRWRYSLVEAGLAWNLQLFWTARRRTQRVRETNRS